MRFKKKSVITKLGRNLPGSPGSQIFEAVQGGSQKYNHCRFPHDVSFTVLDYGNRHINNSNRKIQWCAFGFEPTTIGMRQQMLCVLGRHTYNYFNFHIT